MRALRGEAAFHEIGAVSRLTGRTRGDRLAAAVHARTSHAEGTEGERDAAGQRKNSRRPRGKEPGSGSVLTGPYPSRYSDRTIMNKSPLASKLSAEALGTFVLVFGGAGAAVFSASVIDDATGVNMGIGFLGVALAFGLTVVAMAYAVGHILSLIHI